MERNWGTVNEWKVLLGKSIVKKGKWMKKWILTYGLMSCKNHKLINIVKKDKRK